VLDINQFVQARFWGNIQENVRLSMLIWNIMPTVNSEYWGRWATLQYVRYDLRGVLREDLLQTSHKHSHDNDRWVHQWLRLVILRRWYRPQRSSRDCHRDYRHFISFGNVLHDKKVANFKHLILEYHGWQCYNDVKVHSLDQQHPPFYEDVGYPRP